MLAFHNDAAIKRKYVARVLAHQKADEIVKGKYWENGKGCAVGCTIHGNSHAAYELELGIPQAIARLEDCIFEGMPNANAKLFPYKFLKAIPVGADLSLVPLQFMHWLLVDQKDGVIQYDNDPGKTAIQRVAELIDRKIHGLHVTIQDWESAASAAYTARAADAAAYAAAYAASAAAYAASAQARIKQATKLIQLLKHAPVGEIR